MRRRFRWFAVLLAPVAAAAGCWPSCDAPEPTTPYVSTVAEEPGAAVELLVDCSGSMDLPWHGQRKIEAARAALQGALGATGAFKTAHPDRRIRIGVLAFSSEVKELMPIQDWSEGAVASALAALPVPAGRTAIGEALDVARERLYRSGAIRKYVLVITDGENTTGRKPERVARSIAARSQGAVSISVVAVDMDARKYRFIAELGGQVLQADAPAAVLAAVQQIYEGKILAEAVDAEAGAPAPASSTGSAP